MEMKIPAVVGTVESSDCMVTIRPGQDGVHIDLHSDVERMFGASIRATARQTLAELGVKNAEVDIQDRGALDCVIRARVQCAACRSAQEPYDWSREAACNG